MKGLRGNRKSRPATKCAIAIDLGGTKIAVARVSDDGVIQEKIQWPVFGKENRRVPTPQQIVDQIADMVKIVTLPVRSTNIHGVGFVSAGPLNVDRGELIKPTHYPTWNRVYICKMLEKRLAKIGLKKKIFFQNDAMGSALAEKWKGAATSSDTFAVITLGTGIGVGVIFRGQPLQNKGMGSEWGGGAYNKKTFEDFASGTGILNQAKQMGFEGASVEELVKQIRKGQRKYIEVFDEAAVALASLCYNLSLALNLEMILFSGGLIGVKELFYHRVVKYYKKMLRGHGAEFMAKIKIAKLENDTGIVGAASLVFNSIQKK